ncbi:hypothetical protein OIU78_023517 [Salix suchowensis]|nr:hypothetical protein OIU78_023517 [Salix suchowensis]
MAAINFGGILLRMPELSYDNEEGYGIVLELVLGLFQGRDLFHSLPMLMLIQWSLQGLFLSKSPKFSWNLLGFNIICWGITNSCPRLETVKCFYHDYFLLVLIILVEQPKLEPDGKYLADRTKAISREKL